ncbi:MAG: hypothetical protein WBA13_06195 [Microcoleaceae cyanobacterium]
MRKSQKILKKFSIGIIFCGSILVCNAEPASAFGWWKTDYLGKATTADNGAYWRSRGRVALPTPPINRNRICQWKYPRRSGVYGKASGWETNCYRRYWKWWW